LPCVKEGLGTVQITAFLLFQHRCRFTKWKSTTLFPAVGAKVAAALVKISSAMGASIEDKMEYHRCDQHSYSRDNDRTIFR
ncbi:MAG: hypothetical protein IJP03_04785, partial [Christensenellaceae bacterium]|nr:hypothetical protein [Christensenellaceae bacterium]